MLTYGDKPNAHSRERSCTDIIAYRTVGFNSIRTEIRSIRTGYAPVGTSAERYSFGDIPVESRNAFANFDALSYPTIPAISSTVCSVERSSPAAARIFMSLANLPKETP